MAPRDLLQDTVEYNRKVNLTRKMLKSKKRPLPTLPLMLVGPVQSGVPANVPVKSGKVISRRVAPSGPVIGPCDQECQLVSLLNLTK